MTLRQFLLIEAVTVGGLTLLGWFLRLVGVSDLGYGQSALGAVGMGVIIAILCWFGTEANAPSASRRIRSRRIRKLGVVQWERAGEESQYSGQDYLPEPAAGQPEYPVETVY